MSKQNVEIVRAWVDACNRGDIEDIGANLSPDFEYVPAGMVLDLEAVYRRPEGLRRFWAATPSRESDQSRIVPRGTYGPPDRDCSRPRRLSAF